MPEQLQGQVTNTKAHIEGILQDPTFWSEELDAYDRVRMLEQEDPTFKSLPTETKYSFHDRARRKFHPNIGEKIQDFTGSSLQEAKKYYDAAQPVLEPLRQVSAAQNAYNTNILKGATFGTVDLSPALKQTAGSPQASAMYDNPYIQGAGNLVGSAAPIAGIEGVLTQGARVASVVARQAGMKRLAQTIFNVNRSNLAPYLKDAIGGAIESGLFFGAENQRQETGSPFALGFDPQAAALGGVAAPAFRGLLTGAGKVAQNIFGNNTAPISLPKQNPMEQVNLQGSATKTSTLDDVVGQTTPQRLQAGRDRLQAAISKGDVTIGGKGGVSKTLVERLDKYVSKAQSKGLTKTEQLRAEKTLSEINKRVSNKAKPVAKLPEKKTPEAKPLKGKVEKTTKNISDDTNKVSEAPEHAQLKGSATEMVDQALEGTPYKSLQDIQNDLAERVKYGTSKQAESTKYKATGPMPKTIGALKTAVKKLRAELDDTPELFDTTADQLAKYKKQADLFISDKTTSKDPIGYGEKLYRVLKRLKKVTEINNRLEQVHPHLRELMKSPDIDFKNGTASQIELEPYRTASYNDVKFRLKDKKKYGDLINKAMKQGKQILAKYKANIGGHTSTLEKEAFREKTLTPIAWAKPGKDSVGTRFWAYNEQGHLGQYYVDASRAIDGEVSELVEIPQLLETAGIEGLYANSYKKPGQFKISDWLGRSLREEGVVDREIVRLMESTDKMLQSLIESDLPAPVKQKISKLLDAESIGSKELEVLQKQLRTPKHLKTLEQLCQILGI